MAAREPYRRPVGPGSGQARPLAAAAMTAEGLYPDADWLHIAPLTRRTGLRLTGEADMHTAGILSKALAELPPDAPEIHLHLDGLDFIDVAAARHLAALAERPAHPKVILHAPPRCLVFLMSLLWPDSLDRFLVRGERAAAEPGPGRPRTGQLRICRTAADA